MIANNWLTDQLKEKSNELFDKIIKIYNKAKDELFPFVQLPDYTNHGSLHVKTMLNTTAMLIPKELEESLTPFELFCLFSSIILHDSGMALKKNENEDTDSIRIDHFNRSKDFIIKNHSEYYLSEHEARIIGEICRSHGMPNLDYLVDYPASIKNYGDVRVQFLSALLRLTDILDICSDRAPSSISAQTKISPKSKKHWHTHKLISNVSIKPTPNWDIGIYAFSKTSNDESNLYELRNYIQEELYTTEKILRRNGLFYKRIDILINNEYDKTNYKKLKNPFILLSSFKSNNARLFAGRTKEIQHMIEKIFGKRLVVLIGESGVGKTSLVEAGIVPMIKKYKYDIINFSFQKDPILKYNK